MAGERDLRMLVRGMEPALRDGVWVFATVPPGASIPAGIAPLMTFREAEGTTLILEEEEARMAGIEGTFRSRMVTLQVHSALDAVGFIALVATRLAQAGMGVNPVAGYFHDHLFVPEDRALEAVSILRELAGGN